MYCAINPRFIMKCGPSTDIALLKISKRYYEYRLIFILNIGILNSQKEEIL